MSGRRRASTYDLAFWREGEGLELDDEEVYRRLCEGAEVEGLEEIDSAEIVRGFERALPSFERVDIQTWSEGDASFSTYATTQHLRVDCTGMSGEQMRRLISVASERGCLAYDPQQGARHEE